MNIFVSPSSLTPEFRHFFVLFFLSLKLEDLFGFHQSIRGKRRSPRRPAAGRGGAQSFSERAEEETTGNGHVGFQTKAWDK